MDIEFDDFDKFEFVRYKDVRIHSLEIYENGPYICGIEVCYIVDGEVLKYSVHLKTKKIQQKTGIALKETGHVQSLDKTRDLNLSSMSGFDKHLFKKTPIYFKSSEYINRVRVQGLKYIGFIEIETSLGLKYACGLEQDKSKVNDVDYKMEEDQKVIAFGGVMEVSINECKFINFSVTYKPLLEDCQKGS